MEGVYFFSVSVIWICGASSQNILAPERPSGAQRLPRCVQTKELATCRHKQCKTCICSVSACKGQIGTVEGMSDDQSSNSGSMQDCEEITELTTCRKDNADLIELCKDVNKDSKLYCCPLDTQGIRWKSILHFTCEPESSSQTGTLVGGVVGGLIGGIVITVAIVLLWRICRKRRRHQERPGEQMRDHTYRGPCDASDSQDENKGTVPSVPDIVKASVGSDPGEYAIISESGDQGDYTEITDGISGAAGGGSLTIASHGMNIEGGRKPLHAADKTIGEYNRLGDTNLTTRDIQHAYNRLGNTNSDGANLGHTGNNGSAAEYFVLEESKDNYNRLGNGATVTVTDANSAYHRLGDITDEAGQSKLRDTGAPSSDYFVLEEPADTYIKLGVDDAATTVQRIPITD